MIYLLNITMQRFGVNILIKSAHTLNIDQFIDKRHETATLKLTF